LIKIKQKPMTNLKQICARTMLAALLLTQLAPLAAAQSVPAGYVLVPLGALGSLPSDTSSTTATTELSAEKSTLRASAEYSYAKRNLTLTATLRDTAGNPLAGRKVSLISSNTRDQITQLDTTTNANGEIRWQVSGQGEGVSTYTALETTSGTSLAERAKLVWLAPLALGGDSALLAQAVTAEPTTATPATDPAPAAATTTYALELQANTTTSVNTPLDLTVQIVDGSGVVQENYEGTVSFTSTDTLAILPRDYTFTLLDRGVHTFANAVTLMTPGVTTLTATSDQTDTAAASTDIVVSAAATNSDKPVINAPADKTLTNQSVIQISGTATANSNIAVLVDGHTQTESTTDTDGSYAVALAGLADGEHELAIALLTYNGAVAATSDPVTLTIDTEDPALLTASVAPDTVEQGTSVMLTVTSEAGLVAVLATIAGTELTLVEGAPGEYSASFTAERTGAQSIRVVLTDAAGNTTEAADAASLTVTIPVTLEQIYTKSQNGKVSLSWDPPANHTEVDHYMIRYGLERENLTKTYTTADNGTEWYIDKLNNGTTYYFQIDSVGATGSVNGGSEIVTEVPENKLELLATACDAKIALAWREQADTRIKRYQIRYGLASGDYTETQKLPDDRTTWEVRNLINEVPYYFTIEGLDSANQIVFQTDEEVVATPSGGSCHSSADTAEPTAPVVEQPIQLWQRTDAAGETILVWSPAAGAIEYRVYAGTQPNYFDLPTATVQTPYLKPRGLTAGKEYYFAVKAVYAEGHEAAQFSNVARVEVGPAALLALSVLGSLGSAYALRRRRHS
jgi:hypothetical protein